MRLIPQLIHTIGFSGTHLLRESQDRVGPFFVDLGTDTVDQIGALPLHILRQESAPADGGPEQHISKQTCS